MPIPSQRSRVLLIAAEAAALQPTQSRLEALGLDVTVATESPLALALAVSLSPDLVLLQADDPLETCRLLRRSLREQPTTNSIPVLLVQTAAESPSREAPALSLDGVVRRPFEDGRLEEAVRTALHLGTIPRREVAVGGEDGRTGLWRHDRLLTEFGERLAAEPEQRYCYLLLSLEAAGMDRLRAARVVREAMAKLLSERARRTDLLGAGEDGLYAVIMPRTEISLGAEAALRVRRQIAFGLLAEREDLADALDLKITAGIAPGGGSVPWEAAQRHAQVALEEALALGGDCVCFWSHDHPAVARDDQIVLPAEWR